MCVCEKEEKDKKVGKKARLGKRQGRTKKKVKKDERKT